MQSIPIARAGQPSYASTSYFAGEGFPLLCTLAISLSPSYGEKR